MRFSFFNAHVDLRGPCVTFTDELDLSEETLYQHGVDYDSQKEAKNLEKELYMFCKKIRKEQRVTQKAMSAYTKIPQSGIARIESGKSNVRLSTLLNYLTTLGLKLTITKNK